MQVFPHNSPNQNAFTVQHSKPAWIAILGLWLFAVLGTLAGAGGIMRLVFPLGTLAVGWFLYLRYPVLYIGFTFWTWFLTPFLSRIIDYRNGWDPSRLILVSPYLVTLITLVTFFRYLPKARHLGGLPMVLAFVALCYGSLIGLINSTPTSVARVFLDWLVPIPFSFHLLVNWQDYPSYRQNIQRTFLWGVLVMGAYGLVQYLVAPEWDRYWLIKSEMFTSAGQPEPMAMRIWSTMQSHGRFAITMQSGLLLLLTSKSPWRIPTAMVGTLAFLLTLVRSAWGAFVVGLLIFIPSLKQKLQLRIVMTMLILTICIFPLTTIEPFSERINNRLQTISNIEEDTSFRERKALYDYQLGEALSKFQGVGIGNTMYLDVITGEWVKLNIDSGILNLFFTLGWMGGSIYLSGLILIIVESFSSLSSHVDSFINISFAIGISFACQIIFGSTFISLGGLFLWGFLSLAIAGYKYYSNR